MSEALSFAHSNLAKARAGQKAQYDRSHREVSYNVGDLVLRRNHVLSDAAKGISASLSAKWSGPHRVGMKLTPLVYQLVDSKGRSIGGPVNVADLKPFVARRADLEGEEPPEPLTKAKRRKPDQLPRTHRYALRSRK